MHIRNNRRERIVIDAYLKKGFEVYTKGFPDLLCVKGNQIIFIEVKRKQVRRTKKMGLSFHQKRVIDILKSAGLRVRVVYIQ